MSEIFRGLKFRQRQVKCGNGNPAFILKLEFVTISEYKTMLAVPDSGDMYNLFGT